MEIRVTKINQYIGVYNESRAQARLFIIGLRGGYSAPNQGQPWPADRSVFHALSLLCMAANFLTVDGRLRRKRRSRTAV